MYLYINNCSLVMKINMNVYKRNFISRRSDITINKIIISSDIEKILTKKLNVVQLLIHDATKCCIFMVS